MIFAVQKRMRAFLNTSKANSCHQRVVPKSSIEMLPENDQESYIFCSQQPPPPYLSRIHNNLSVVKMEVVPEEPERKVDMHQIRIKAWKLCKNYLTGVWKVIKPEDLILTEIW